MELVYLWVEEYKNIKNQGFNFSPRFTCEYNEITKKLTIEEKKDYVSIFPENINITAIVGENGSGKSGLIETLLLSTFGSLDLANKQKNIDFFVIYYEKNNEKFYITTYHDKYATIIANLDFFKNLYSKNRLEMNGYLYNKVYSLYLNFSIDTPSSFFRNTVMNGEYLGFIYDSEETPKQNNILALPNKKNDIIDIHALFRDFSKCYMRFLKEYNMNTNQMDDFFKNIFLTESNFIFIPKQFKLIFSEHKFLSFFNNEKYLKLIKLFISSNNIHNNISIDTLKNITIFFILVGLENKSSFSENLFYSYNKDYIKNHDFIDFLKKINQILNTYQNEDNTDLNSTLEKINSIISSFDIYFQDKKLIDCIGNSIESLFPSIKEAIWYLDYIHGTNELQKSGVNSFNNWNKIQKESLNKLLVNLPSYILLDLKDNTHSRNFLDLSFGEKLLHFLIYELLYFVKFFHTSKQYETINIIYDEFDIGMHPNLQRKFIYIIKSLCDFINITYKNIKINFIFATHSPFILSDIPKQNIIFLEQYKQQNKEVINQTQQIGNCKNRSKEITIDTFGANIHTLLSHGFFMKEGLMGEFAKSKINEIIQNLQRQDYDPSQEEKKKIFSIIKSIGETFLKSKLLEMYYKKFNDDFIKEQRKKDLLEQQQKIQEELKLL